MYSTAQVKSMAKSVGKSIKNNPFPLKHQKILDALAAGLGEKNFDVLSSKSTFKDSNCPEANSMEEKMIIFGEWYNEINKKSGGLISLKSAAHMMGVTEVAARSTAERVLTTHEFEGLKFLELNEVQQYKTIRENTILLATTFEAETKLHKDDPERWSKQQEEKQEAYDKYLGEREDAQAEAMAYHESHEEHCDMESARDVAEQETVNEYHDYEYRETLFKKDVMAQENIIPKMGGIGFLPPEKKEAYKAYLKKQEEQEEQESDDLKYFTSKEK